MGSAGTGISFLDKSKRVRQRLTLAIVALFTFASLASCSGFFIKPTVSSIFVTPSAVTVGVGQMATLSATATYSDGTQNQISGSSVGWTSSAPNVATVTSPGGAVTGVALGSATMTASSQGISGTATVTVTLSNITSLVITTNEGSTQPITTATINGTTGTQQFFAYANGSSNNDVTQSVTWTSSNTNVATISSGATSGNGLATAVAAGTTNITATTTNTQTGQLVTSQTIVLTVTQ